MASILPTNAEVGQRYQDLIGEDTIATPDALGQRHINRSIYDILNAYPFSWALKTADLTLSSGTASLPSDYNPLWGLQDARIVVTGTDTDHVFSQIEVRDRDIYTTDDYVWWRTYDSDTHTFNSLTLTGTVTIYYYALPADLSGTTDVCVVPDAELVAYLAASKNWIGNERNTELKKEYKAEADRLLTALWIRDCMSGPQPRMGSAIDDNDQLLSEEDTLEISVS